MPYYVNPFDYQTPVRTYPWQYYNTQPQPAVNLVQPPQSQYQVPQAAPPSQSSIFIWVKGLDEANDYQVAPNCTVELWDSTEQRIFLKSADSTGMTSIKILPYTIEDVPNLVSRNAKSQEAAPSPSQEEFAELASMVKALASDMQEFRNDLYGVAGKPASKKEMKIGG